MLPAVDPDELERALAELHKPFIMANQGGYDLPYPMSWERAIQSDGSLTDLQLKLLRETLLKLNCSVTVYSDLNYGIPAYGPTVPVHQDVITTSGRLPIGIGAKEGTSRCARDIPEHPTDPCRGRPPVPVLLVSNPSARPFVIPAKLVLVKTGSGNPGR
jgi:hypothetical protein